MTRLWIFSDLHIEQSNWDFSSAPPAFDVMVAAGDIDQSPAHAINWLADRAEGKPVVYVPGNHEWYSPKLDTNVEAETRRGRRVAAERGVHFLMNEAVKVAGLRFLGATLWTDYEFGGDPAGSMALAERCINDHRLIYPDHSAARLSAAIAREWHRASRRWLEDELMVANTCPTVVVTHHLPHPRSVGCTMPRNAASDRAYSGINILILWAVAIRGGYSSQRWLTFRQAQAAGGSVRRGEKGVTVCYADRFTPRAESERACDEDRDARAVAFLKRFTVFNVDQCEGLPEAMTLAPELPPERDIVPRAEALVAATGADLRIGGGLAYYAADADFVAVPPRQAFGDQVNWYRTALHELGHWTGHRSRLGREQSAAFASADYAREELIAELASAFTCASLSIQPTVRHADYIGAWLAVLCADERAIFRAASAASKAADYLLQFDTVPGVAGP